jgi:hypothetical protein
MVVTFPHRGRAARRARQQGDQLSAHSEVSSSLDMRCGMSTPLTFDQSLPFPAGGEWVGFEASPPTRDPPLQKM